MKNSKCLLTDWTSKKITRLGIRVGLVRSYFHDHVLSVKSWDSVEIGNWNKAIWFVVLCWTCSSLISKSTFFQRVKQVRFDTYYGTNLNGKKRSKQSYFISSLLVRIIHFKNFSGCWVVFVVVLFLFLLWIIISLDKLFTLLLFLISWSHFTKGVALKMGLNFWQIKRNKKLKLNQINRTKIKSNKRN